MRLVPLECYSPTDMYLYPVIAPLHMFTPHIIHRLKNTFSDPYLPFIVVGMQIFVDLTQEDTVDPVATKTNATDSSKRPEH